MQTNLDLGGIRLEGWFQRYETPDPIVTGEILTRPDSSELPEAYFSGLGIVDQFSVFEWHLGLSHSIADVLGASVAINIHNRLVESNSDRDRFIAMISAHETPVTLEFTETYPMPPVEIANRMLREIRECGHRSALDDFGAGLNGMSLLTEYDFDVIKLDRSLILDLADRPEKQKTMRVLAQMIDVLGKSHVVEGVETEVVHRILLDAGFSTFQGYLFHHPQSLSELFDVAHGGVIR